MELSNKRGILGVLTSVGVLTALAAAKFVSDPNTRHVIEAIQCVVRPSSKAKGLA